MKGIHRIALFFIVILCISLRLYKINGPVADWHSWRQADTAAVARNFLRTGFDLFQPRYDDLSNIQSGKDNPRGYRMVEFPLYQGVGALLAKAFPALPVEVWLRLVTIGASAGTVLLLALMVGRLIDPTTGLLAGLVFAILPYSMYYGRTILPEPFAVFWAVLSLYILVVNNRKHWLTLFASGISAAIALLVKPTAGFLLLPAVYLLASGKIFPKQIPLRLLAYFLISAVPLLWWRRWIMQFPEGIPAYEWLLNNNGIRFKGAWFNWLFAERLGRLILGYWGLIPLGLGFAATPSKKEGWVFRWLLIGALLYWIVFASGNVQHDYYQIIILPVVGVCVAKGLSYLLGKHEGINRYASVGLALSAIVFMCAFSWFTVRTYYWVNRPEIVEAGIAADALLPQNAKVIASYNGDTSFLYQTKRQGWPLGFDIDKKIAAGATHYVTVSPSDNDGETRDLASRFTVLVRNERYAIIDLTKPVQRSAR